MVNSEKTTQIIDWIRKSNQLKTWFLEDGRLDSVEKAADLMGSALSKGYKILSCGNGGSCSDSGHLAAELLNQFSKYRTKPLAAIDLSAMNSTITAIGNDSDYKYSFSKQLEVLGQEGDVLFAISTSGYSPNIVQAIKTAFDKKIKVVFLTSDKYKENFFDFQGVVIKTPSSITPLIQELHISIIHILCNLIDYEMVGKNYLDEIEGKDELLLV